MLILDSGALSLPLGSVLSSWACGANGCGTSGDAETTFARRLAG
jgi:hypothetical protein